MNRTGKLLFTLLVLILACSLVLVAGSSATNTTNKGGKKLIKIWVDKDNGEILDVKLTKNDGSDQDSIPVSPAPSAQYIGTILFTHSSPGCIYMITASGAARKVCW